jgi:hypothetical protein
MRFYYLIFCFLGTVCVAQGQDLSKLEQKNGFKELKLGADFTRHRAKFDTLEREADGYKIYNSKSYEAIGHIPIELVTVLTYKNKIHEVRILTDFAHFEELKSILTQAYGEPKDKPCELLEVEQGKRTDCAWRSENVLHWCTAIEFKDYQKTVIGFKAYKLAEKAKKELTQKAIGDL